jgi:hypothetical protein
MNWKEHKLIVTESPVWKIFLINDEETYTKCRYCSNCYYIYSGGTGNMLNHSMKYHPQEFNITAEKKLSFIENLSMFFITSGTPFNILNNEYFKNICLELPPHYEYLRKNIINMVPLKKEDLLNKLLDINNLFLTLIIDSWSGNNGEHFLVYQYVDKHLKKW